MILPLIVAAALADAAPPAPSVPSATAYYVAALHATRSAQQPDYATYHTAITSMGMKFALVPVKGEVGFAMGYGSGMHSSAQFDAAYTRAGNRVVAIIEQKLSVVRISMFNPTWGGMANFMKYGFYGPDAEAVGTPLPSPTPSASASPVSSEPHNIATVNAIDPGGYSITDGGAARCEDGSPGHKLRLRALRDPETHPLTSVVVSSDSMRFCTMEFRLGANSALSFTGAFELHLGNVGGNWLVTDGTADFAIRMLGISAQHTRLSFVDSDFLFEKPAGVR